MPHNIKRHAWKGIFILVFSFMTIVSASLQAKQSVVPESTDEETQESIMVHQIEQGERKFLFPLDDGYLYPVEVVEPVFIETMPLKIQVQLFHQHRTVAVPVELLQVYPSYSCETVNIERYDAQQWKTVKGAHRFNNQYLGQIDNETFWQVINDNLLRIKVSEGE